MDSNSNSQRSSLNDISTGRREGGERSLPSSNTSEGYLSNDFNIE